MSAATLDRVSRPLFAERAGDRPGHGRQVTLEQRLQASFRAVHRHGTAECPVCRGPMVAQGAAARCGGCGSTLS